MDKQLSYLAHAQKIAGANPAPATLWDVAQFGSAPDSGSGGRGFKSRCPNTFGPLAQMAEQVAVNHRVTGSSPVGAANVLRGSRLSQRPFKP